MRKQLRARVSPGLVVVGVGTSAGGLDTLARFFAQVAAPSAVAFVVVQHLDPSRKGMLVPLLAKTSPIPVLEAEDGMALRAGSVHVIPPNKDMALEGGRLRLHPPVQKRGLRLPIDILFRSLARELGPRASGVVLSGMGTDGTLGLAAIRENAGASFVEEPSSAKFDAMPRSAIAAGVADVVVPVEEIPRRIDEWVARTTKPETTATLDDTTLTTIVTLLRVATGQDFALYKTSTIRRRVERRMGVHQLDGAAYVRLVRENPKEAELLASELLIGVTSFFRDPAEWKLLEDVALPELLAAAPNGAVLRAWVPACSTGEEAYSLAIAFREARARSRSSKEVALQIFATDLDGSAIARARRGVYPTSIAADVGKDRLNRYFTATEGGWRIRKSIRDSVVFATQDVVQDPPFTRLDVLSCRNLLIYLTPQLQQRLIPLFHYSLRPQGLLFLGSAETVGGFGDLFAPIQPRSRLHRRLESGARPLPPDLPPALSEAKGVAAAASAQETSDASAPNLQAAVERQLLHRFTPAAVLVSARGDVLYVSGSTGKFLELPAGKTNWNILAMAREGLKHALMSAFREATRARTTVRFVAHTDVGRSTPSVEVVLQPLEQPPALRGTVLVVFSDAVAQTPPTNPKLRRGRSATTELERELRIALEELHATRAEMQSSEEELRAANEELQSTNEELQSTNEELTTSKEEMQSMNEELQTLNAELQAKVDELSDASNDMRNLLDSTEIAVLFLDEALNVRRFTPQAALLINLIPTDLGRPLSDLTTDLDYSALDADARAVLRTLVFRERTVSTKRGASFRVRVMPYRTTDNRIDGVVITFTNVTPPEQRRAKAEAPR